MVFDENSPSDNLEKDAAIGTEFEEEDPDAAEFDLDQAQMGAHKAMNKYCLDIRRAIEDHLEESKLRREFDYLYDDDFGLDDEESK